MAPLAGDFSLKSTGAGPCCCNLPRGEQRSERGPEAGEPDRKVIPTLKRTLIVLPTVAALLMSATVAFAAIPPHPKWKSSKY
jgi:hypothetical protein